MTQRMQQISGTSTRQKVTAGLLILIVLFVIWEVIGMFRGKPTTTQTQQVVNQPPPRPMAPQQAQLPSSKPPMTQQEIDLLNQQQANATKYLTAVNELQMLRLEQQIAEANKAIMSAKLDTVTAEKSIVDLLKPPQITQSTYSQGLISPIPSGAPLIQGVVAPSSPSETPKPATPVVTAPVVQQVTTVTPVQPEIAYTVISVSNLLNHWAAVIGFQGSLYSVSVGDFLPPDQSKVVAIDKSGVVLLKNGIKRKVSLVPII